MNEHITLEVQDQEICIPVKVVFVTCFLIESDSTTSTEFTLAEENFLNFLQRNNIEYTGPEERKIHSNELDYSCPSFNIVLDQPSYLLLEKYRDTHSELSGFVIESFFAEDDKKNLLQKLHIKAQSKAMEIAQSKGLILLENPTIQEVFLKKNNWVTLPPLRAKINHFRQLMRIQYKYQFFTKKNFS